MVDDDYAPFVCSVCSRFFCAWLPNSFNLDGCVTCGLCKDCLSRKEARWS